MLAGFETLFTKEVFEKQPKKLVRVGKDNFSFVA